MSIDMVVGNVAEYEATVKLHWFLASKPLYCSANCENDSGGFVVVFRGFRHSGRFLQCSGFLHYNGFLQCIGFLHYNGFLHYSGFTLGGGPAAL